MLVRRTPRGGPCSRRRRVAACRRQPSPARAGTIKPERARGGHHLLGRPPATTRATTLAAGCAQEGAPGPSPSPDPWSPVPGWNSNTRRRRTRGPEVKPRAIPKTTHSALGARFVPPKRRRGPEACPAAEAGGSRPPEPPVSCRCRDARGVPPIHRGRGRSAQSRKPGPVGQLLETTASNIPNGLKPARVAGARKKHRRPGAGLRG